jgi:hypothetical protein
LTDEAVELGLDDNWLKVRRAARELAAQRLGLPSDSPNVVVDRDDTAMAVVLWREHLLNPGGVAPESPQRRELTPEERAWVDRYMGRS